MEDYEDFCRSADVLDAVFGASSSEAEMEAMREERPRRFAEYEQEPHRQRYLALLDDRPAAAATGVFTDVGVCILAGGATLPDVRGRGAYRALVQARWEDAKSRACHALVTQASEMSRPILQAMGFQAVGRVLELLDTTT